MSGRSPVARLDLDWEAPVSAASGEAVIAAAVKTLPNAPGVYRMIDGDGDVLYVGKARSLKKRVISYTRLAGQSGRIARMIRATTTMDFVRTRTETEALLLEANLIKRLRPRFNVLLPRRQVLPLHPDRRGSRGAGDHEASRRAAAEGKLFRPVRLGRRGRPHRQHAAEGVPDPHLLGRGLRTAARGPACSSRSSAARRPARGEIALDDYRRLVEEAKAFLTGSSQEVKAELAREMEAASATLDFETRRALSRPARGALAHPVAPGHQSARRRRGGRLRHPPGRRPHLDPGLLLPHRTELGKPRLLSEGRQEPRRAGGARAVPRAVLRRQAGAAADPRLARLRGARASGDCALRAGRAQGRDPGAAARREARAGRARARERARGAGAKARRHVEPGEAARRPRRSLWPPRSRRAASRSTTTAT